MKWRANRPGEKRTVRRFAFLPTQINGEWVWLETYFEEQEWSRLLTIDPYKWWSIRKFQNPDHDSPSIAKTGSRAHEV